MKKKNVCTEIVTGSAIVWQVSPQEIRMFCMAHHKWYLYAKCGEFRMHSLNWFVTFSSVILDPLCALFWRNLSKYGLYTGYSHRIDWMLNAFVFFWRNFPTFLNVSFGVLHTLFKFSAIHVSFIKRWHHFIAINNDVIDWKLDPIQKSQP